MSEDTLIKCDRRIFPKVRTGCDTCKKRRVKCDEAKPTCDRCKRGNFPCSGYNTIPTVRIFEIRSPVSEAKPTTVQPEERKKRPHTKSFNGCASCRSRRIKCDEKGPPCSPCRKASKLCPGYPVRANFFGPYRATDCTERTHHADTYAPKVHQLKRAHSGDNCQCFKEAQRTSYLTSAQGCLEIYDHPTKSSPVTTSQSQTYKWLMTSSPANKLSTWLLTSSEARAMQFFHEKSKPELKAFNSTAALFFDELLPQLCFTSPIIKRQLVVIGLLHEQHITGSSDHLVPRRIAEAFHNETIAKVAAVLSEEETYLVLSQCLLFFAAEMLKGASMAAFKHLKCGLALLQSVLAKLNSTTKSSVLEPLIVKTIQPIFAQLAATASLVQGSGIDLDVQLCWNPVVIPEKFETCKEAWNKLFEIAQYGTTTDGRPQGVDSSEIYWLQWHDRLQKLMPRLANGSPRVYLQGIILQLLHRMRIMTIACQEAADEMKWDEYLEEMQDQLVLCEQVCTSPHTYVESDAASEDNFEVRPGVYPALYTVAANCRDPATRRKALDLMQIHHARCGHTDVCYGMFVVQGLCEMEEAGLGEVRQSSDVPAQARIRSLVALYTDEPVCTYLFSRWPHKVSESLELPLPPEYQHQARITVLRPISAAWKCSGYQGLMRLRADSCMCKSHGSA